MHEHKKAELKGVEAELQQWEQVRGVGGHQGGLAAGRLISPTDPAQSLPRVVSRPTIERMINADPSEAADSDNIIAALRSVFPDVTVEYTGGVIYQLALGDVLANFDEDEDALQTALLLDDALSEMGENHYAIAFARKLPKERKRRWGWF